MKKEIFEELSESIRQGGEIMRGRSAPSRVIRMEDPDVPAIRKHLRLSQDKFAQLLGVNVATLRNWEQGRRKPTGAARVLLYIAAKDPEAVLNAIHS